MIHPHALVRSVSHIVTPFVTSQSYHFLPVDLAPVFALALMLYFCIPSPPLCCMFSSALPLLSRFPYLVLDLIRGTRTASYHIPVYPFLSLTCTI